MKKTYKDLKELRKAIEDGSLDGEKLRIVLDNDHTGYYYDDGTEDGTDIIVKSAGNGYSDYFELYELYFPKCTVEGC